MTEFFNHLVARSGRFPAPEGEGKILLPRLPSLFEAPGYQAAPSGEDSAGVALEGGLHEIPSNPNERGDRPRRFSTTREGLLPQTNQPFEPPRGQGTEADKTDRRRSRATGERRDQEEGDAGQFRTSVPGIPVQPREAFVLESARDSAQHTRGPAAEERRRPAGEAAALTPAAGNAIHPLVSLQRHEAQPPHPSRPPAGRRGGDEAGEAAGEADAWPPQAPTVHISIGRIEVRAAPVASQPPARPPAPVRPRLSLDEYLRRRNEGKR